MKFNRNFKVQYKSKRLTTPSDDYRYLLYRIVPSELPLWKRIFCNGWRYVYNDVFTHETEITTKTIDDLLSTLFTYDEAVEFINSHKTYGELVDTLNSVYNKAEKLYNKIMSVNNRWDF